jgi:hypothetical protein
MCNAEACVPLWANSRFGSEADIVNGSRRANEKTPSVSPEGFPATYQNGLSALFPLPAPCKQT